MIDSEIINQILQGDRKLVGKYQAMVLHTCMVFLHHNDDADDLTQEM